jgi:hypothetical protein
MRWRCALTLGLALLALGCGKSKRAAPSGAPVSAAQPAPVPVAKPQAALAAPSSAASSSAGGSPCALAPAAEVGATLGISALMPPVAEHKGARTLCQYGTAYNPRTVVIAFESGHDAGELAKAKAEASARGPAPDEIKGLGEAALASSAKGPHGTLNTVMAFKGDKTLQVLAAAPRDRVVALVRALLAKL